MKKMIREKQFVSQLILLSGTLSAVFGDDLFGMRLTTETLKTKENTRYRFHYFVKDEMTGDYKTQEETKNGDSVHGSYTVAEPNGDLRTVTYKAGPKTGFEAKVEVRPSASPMKTIKDTTLTTTASTAHVKTTNWVTTENSTTVESNVQYIPGGFVMDVLKKPLTNQSTPLKTEMVMKFSLNTNFATEPFTNTASTVSAKAEEKTEISTEPIRTTLAATPAENLELFEPENSTEYNKIDDLIEKELDEVENSMPKLPELVLPDNKTHFKFYKDPEEAFLDERITQIARQLAETSLRREYEERKLGHFIPISVTPVEPSAPSYWSKSFKFTKDDAPRFKTAKSTPVQALTKLKLIPQYIYKDKPRLNYFLNQKLPVVQTNKPTRNYLQWDQQTYETITNVPEILKINKSELQVQEINKIIHQKGRTHDTNYDTTDADTVSAMPINVPTFLQFSTLNESSTQENYVTQTKTEPQTRVTLTKDLAKTEIPFRGNGTAHFPVTVADNFNVTE